MTDVKLTRSQIAELLGVTTKTLYTWEKEGRCAPPERDWRGWRWYSQEHIESLKKIVGTGIKSRIVSRRGNKSKDEIKQTVSPSALPALDISARNRLVGTIKNISEDGVLAEVVIDLGSGNEIVSVITQSSVSRLGLEVGSKAVALIKATEVMIARER